MKKHLLFILTAILSFNCYAQIAFEKGYYINDNDLRIDCLIKNIDWKNNPTTFEYKLTEDAKVELEVLKNIKGFGFDDATKYIKAAVKIDRSSENINYLSKEKDPIFSLGACLVYCFFLWSYWGFEHLKCFSSQIISLSL